MLRLLDRLLWVRDVRRVTAPRLACLLRLEDADDLGRAFELSAVTNLPAARAVVFVSALACVRRLCTARETFCDDVLLLVAEDSLRRSCTRRCDEALRRVTELRCDRVFR